jgi:uncharacterized protein
VRLLIDGYNLMHAAGYLTSRKSGRIESIRRRFLTWLEGVAVAKAVPIAIVFDGFPPRNAQLSNRLEIRFANERTADDEIEAMLLTAGERPIVISNDGRLHEAARRAGATAWRCERFLDWVLEDRPTARPIAGPDEKPIPTGDEADLLAAFGKPRGRP